MPEAVTVQMEERHRDVAALARWTHDVPVDAKEFQQVFVELNEVGGDTALTKQIYNRQEQQGFVRGAVGGGLRPVAGVFVGVEFGKLFLASVEVGHFWANEC